MNAHVSFNIFKKSRKSDKMQGLLSISSCFGNEFNKLITTLWSMNVRY